MLIGGYALAIFGIQLVFALRALLDVWPTWVVVTMALSFIAALVGLAARMDDLEEQPSPKEPQRQVQPDGR